MMQHEPKEAVHVVNNYNLDTLGAPFSVILVDSICAKIDPKTGAEMIDIPDLPGLIRAVVRSRATHPRKLSGADIKYIRKALSVRAKVMAEFLDMSPEHLSRCENGKEGSSLSPASERQLRFASFLGTFFEEPEALFSQSIDVNAAERKPTSVDKSFESLVKLFFSMKIQPVFDVSRPLELRLTRRSHNVSAYSPCGSGSKDGEWEGNEHGEAA